ncbi:MAG TPA: DUF2281 domain-containing protein [Chitinispirillaceae bacterium]|nr:DUF2281 domain-containing protein [Chitinispirillaceae bacterium]
MTLPDPREDILKNMPPAIKAEVLDFAEFLMRKKKTGGLNKRLKQNWAGALSQYRDKYSSLELQKKALEWR